MKNYLMGLVGGTVVAGLGLGTASYLIPTRVDAPTLAVAAMPEPAAPMPAAPEPAVPEPAVPEPAVPEPAVPEPAVTESAMPEPAAPEPAMPEPAAPEPAVPEPAVPEPAVPTNEALLDPAPTDAPEASREATPEPAVESDAQLEPETQLPPSEGAPMLPAPEETVADIPPVIEPQVAPDAPPLQRFAAAFDGAAGKPLLAIVIVDTGSPDIDRAVWASLSLPISFAVDPDSETAPAALALYRAAGKEVIMLPQSLPEGATASDIETSFAAYNAILPETVAVMSAPNGGFQDNRALTALVIPAIGAQGRGLVIIDKGLNSAGQIAQRGSIPYAAISRAIDGAGESVPVMRRYLDRAVFQAAQDGAAAIMGSTLPDTMTALTEWAVEGRAGDVTLAPISALMQPAE